MLRSLPEKPELALRLAPIRREEWDAYTATTPYGLIFHQAHWLDLLATVYDHTWQPLGVWQADQLRGLLPLQTRRLGPFRLAGSPLMHVIASTPMLGPVSEPALIGPILTALEAWLSTHQIDHIEVALPQHVTHEDHIRALGYQLEVCHTVQLPLAPASCAERWASCSAACRRAIRKAEASGVQIDEPQDGAFVAAYYQLCQEVYQEAGRAPHLAQDFYTALWNTLAPRGQLKVLLAYRGSWLLAGAIFVLDRDTVYYLSGASCRDGLNYRPNNLIQWELIRWALAQGYRCYDLGGATVAGITRFKLSFGAQLVPYTRLYRARTLQAQFGRVVYQHTIPWWRRLNRD
ncbi:MAG: lipid II:glycine glycyltransferase FemX [Oscillochloridaceae bacterium umkhey_bin13]